MTLTPAQTSALAYYAALSLTDKDARRAAKKGNRCPDPRVHASLVEKGLLERVGYHYGPVYGLTDAGRASL